MKTRISKFGVISAVVATGLIFGALPAWALRYKPKADEPLAHIARIHYGHSRKKIYLTSTNRIADPNKLPKGKTLWIPTVWKYRVKRGDDLSRMAKKYLKDAKRSEFLMWLNQIKDPTELQVGQMVTIPFLIRHRVQEGQTMVDLAKRYYWKSKAAGLLRKFNQKRTNALKPGELIFVPIYDKETMTDKVKNRMERYEEKEAKEAEEARERAKRMAAAKAQERADKVKAKNGPADSGTDTPSKPIADAGPAEPKSDPVADPMALLDGPRTDADGKTASSPTDLRIVNEAVDLYRDGEFELAKANLMRVLEKGDLAVADETEAREVLAQCLVAMDETTAAEHEFVRLLMVDPEHKLSPVTTSPKVLEVFRKAKGSR